MFSCDAIDGICVCGDNYSPIQNIQNITYNTPMYYYYYDSDNQDETFCLPCELNDHFFSIWLLLHLFDDSFMRKIFQLITT